MTETTLLLAQKPLSRLKKIGYGLGHVQNDLSACLWFSYTLGFLKLVISKNIISGLLIMMGQLLDAFATPFAGYILDRTTDKKKWHIIGCITTSCSFPFIYATCIYCGDNITSKGLYYAAFISIFQIGWAFVQISHLSLLPVLSKNAAEKSDLTAYRYAASMLSNILLYAVTFAIFHGSATGELSLFTPDDTERFFGIALTLTAIGLVSSTVFHLIVKTERPAIVLQSQTTGQRQKWTTLAKWQLLKIAVIYSSSRLFVNVTIEYMVLYLNEAVTSNKDTISIIPLTMFTTSAFTSLLYKYITFSIGWVISIAGCVVIFVRTERSDNIEDLLIAAILFGAGSALTLVVSLSFAANIVSAEGTEGFVYSMVTFADKAINGIAVLCIELMKCESVDVCMFSYKNVLTYLNAIVITVGMIFACLIPLNIATLEEHITQCM